MSRLSYLEIAVTNGKPLASLGDINSEGVVADLPNQGARLRIYISKKHNPTRLSLELVRLIEPLLMRALALPWSARNKVHNHSPDASQQRFFQTSLNEISEGAALNEILWIDVEDWLVRVSDDMLFLETNGECAELMMLFDAIRDDRFRHGSRGAQVIAPVIDDPHQAAIKFRDELLRKNWLDAKSVAVLVGARDDKDPAQHAEQLRAEGRLLGVWSMEDCGFLYPDFQFGDDGVRPEVAELLKTLPENKDDRGGWRRAFWLYSPHAKLDKKPPADVFTRDPLRVIQIAITQFHGEQDADW